MEESWHYSRGNLSIRAIQTMNGWSIHSLRHMTGACHTIVVDSLTNHALGDNPQIPRGILIIFNETSIPFDHAALRNHQYITQVNLLHKFVISGD